MAQQKPPVPASVPSGDPWRAFSYVVSGVVLYGFVGWALDRWLGTDFLVAIGVVAGAAMGIYLTWKAFPSPSEDQQDPPPSSPS